MAVISEQTGIHPIKINGVEFTPLEGIDYRFNYLKLFDNIQSGKVHELKAWREMILNDLWFIIYFVMGIKDVNEDHRKALFTTRMCKEVEMGPQTKTLDVWARFHYKSTIITIAETAQYHLKNPEHCTCIFSYKKPAAEKFLDSVRRIYETEIVKACFPDIVYENPDTQSPSWSLQNGITLKRKSMSRPQKTIEASGLIEGMSTGGHYERRIYDDVETADMEDSPDLMKTLFSRFEMSRNLGTGKDSDIERIIGTFYSHAGALTQIKDKETIDKEKMYSFRCVPGSDDGTATGKPVLVSAAKWKELQTDEYFYSQILCDPTPKGNRKLSREMLNDVDPTVIPKYLPSFLLVDWAGDENGNSSDSWAIGVVEVDPNSEDLRASKIYITDMVLSPMKEPQAVDMIIKMYLRNHVEAMCVEKTNSGILGLHVAGLLNDRHKKRVTEADKTLVYLKPAGRNKKQRISTALEIPFLNGNVHISTNVDPAYRDRLKQEMDNFPMWHDDGLDMLSYLYDILADTFWQARLKVYRKPETDIHSFDPHRHLSLLGNEGWMAA